MIRAGESTCAAAAARSLVRESGRPSNFVGTRAAPILSTAQSTGPRRSRIVTTVPTEALSPDRYTVGRPSPDRTKPVTSALMKPSSPRSPSMGPWIAGTAVMARAPPSGRASS